MKQVIYILDIFDDVIGQLNNEIPSGCPFWEDRHVEKLENGYETFEFNTMLNHSSGFPKLLENENKVGFVNRDGDFKLFRIKTVRDETHKNQRHVWAELDSIELYNEVVRPMEVSGSPKQFLQTILSGTRWTVGRTENLATQIVKFEEHISIIYALHEGRRKFNAEINFRFELDNGEVVGRYVDMVSRLGVDTGKRVEYSKDLLGLTRTRDTKELATALIGLGGADTNGNRLTIKDVIWDKTQGDPVNKPLGQDWIGDPELLSAYSPNGRHIFNIHDDGETSNAEALIENTWKRLQSIKNGQYAYEVDILLLEDITGYEGDKLRKGDTLIIVDRTYPKPLYISARVLDLNRSMSDPKSDTVLLGEFRELQLTTPAWLRDIQGEIIRKKPQWESIPTPGDIGAIERGGIVDTDFPNVTPPASMGFTATGLFKTIKLDWDFNASSYISAYEVYGSMTTGFVPDSTNLLFRGKTSGFVHQADADQTWYYRLCSVNTQGTRSEYTIEVSASTVRIITDDILFGAVNAEKIANLAITAEKIADGSIDIAKIVDGAITNAKLANGAVNNVKLAELSVDAAKLVDGAVTTTKIANLAVGSAAIQDAAITNAKIGNLAVSSAHIQDLAISSAKIVDAAIVSAKIADLAVGNAAIQNGAITNAKIGTAAISTAQIQDAAITSAKIGTLAVDTAHIADAAITNAKISNLDVGKLTGRLLVVGNSSTTTKLNISTSDTGVHSIESTQGNYGFLIKSASTMRFTAGTGSLIYTSNGMDVGGQVTASQFQDKSGANNLFNGQLTVNSAINAKGGLVVDVNSVTLMNGSSLSISSGTLKVGGLTTLDGAVATPRVHSRSTSETLDLYISTSTSTSYRALQLYLNDAYFKGNVHAAGVQLTSRRENKKEIEPVMELSLSKVKSTPVYKYRYKIDTHETKKTMGLMFDEMPEDIRSTDGVDLYAMASLMWKAIQELSDEVDILRKGVK